MELTKDCLETWRLGLVGEKPDKAEAINEIFNLALLGLDAKEREGKLEEALGKARDALGYVYDGMTDEEYAECRSVFRMISAILSAEKEGV